MGGDACVARCRVDTDICLTMYMGEGRRGRLRPPVVGIKSIYDDTADEIQSKKGGEYVSWYSRSDHRDGG